MLTMDTTSWGVELIESLMNVTVWTEVNLSGNSVPWTQLTPVPQTALDVFMFPLGMVSGMVFQGQELVDDQLTTNPWTEK